MKIVKLFRDWDAREEYEAGDVIFSEREPAVLMYVILSGEVELTLHGTSLGIEGEGGIIGEMAVIDSGTRSATATARSKAELAGLDRDQFRKMVRENSEFSLHAMTVFANRLRSVDGYISTRLKR